MSIEEHEQAIKKTKLFKDGVQLVQLIGEGGFGKVFKVTTTENKVLAIKVQNINPIGERERRRDFQHEHLLETYPHLQFTTERFIYTTSKYIGESLRDYRENKLVDGIDEGEVWEMINQIQQALNHMHSKPNFTIHRDVKLDNILKCDHKSFHLVLADYGLCKSELTNHMVSHAGTLGFIAPELKEKNVEEFPYKCDVYSFGKTICHFIFGKRFHMNDTNQQILEKLKRFQVPELLIKLIKSMIEEDPKKRFDIESVGIFYKKHKPTTFKLLQYSKGSSEKAKSSRNNSKNHQSRNNHSSSRIRKKTSKPPSFLEKTWTYINSLFE